jgi:hypothetical protein
MTTIENFWENLPRPARWAIMTVSTVLISKPIQELNIPQFSNQEISLIMGISGGIILLDAVQKTRIQAIHEKIDKVSDIVPGIQSTVAKFLMPDGGESMNNVGSTQAIFGGALIGTAVGSPYGFYVPFITGFIFAAMGDYLVGISSSRETNITIPRIKDEIETERLEDETQMDDDINSVADLLPKTSGPTILAQSLIQLSQIFVQNDEPKRAIPHLQNSLEILDETGDRTGVAVGFEYLGDAYAEIGDYEEAVESYHIAWTIYSDLDEGEREASIHYKMGLIAMKQENWGAAQEYFKNSIQISNEIYDIN